MNLSDEKVVEVEETISEILQNDVKALIEQSLFLLSKSEKIVVIERIFNKRTFASIGRQHGATPSRTHQIFHSALRKIRHPANMKKINELR